MELILYGHAQCSLCDRLEELVLIHLGSLSKGNDVTLQKRDINDDPQWRDTYQTRIPVLEHNKQVILEGRPSIDEVARAIDSLVESRNEN